MKKQRWHKIMSLVLVFLMMLSSTVTVNAVELSLSYSGDFNDGGYDYKFDNIQDGLKNLGDYAYFTMEPKDEWGNGPALDLTFKASNATGSGTISGPGEDNEIEVKSNSDNAVNFKVFYEVINGDWRFTVTGNSADHALSHFGFDVITPVVAPTGSLEITKIVDLGDYSDVQLPDFEISITGPSYPNGDTKTFTSPNALEQIWDNLIPGEYAITEENPGTSWIITLPDDVTVTANNIAEANVTNTYNPDAPPAPTGSLEITKVIDLGDYLGIQLPDFEISITGPSYPNGDTKTFTSPDALEQIWDNLIPGEYTITEENPGTSWIITLPEDVTVTANNIAEATVTNTYNPDAPPAPTGSLEITKVIDLGDYLDIQLPDFEISITGPSYPNGDTKTFTSPDALEQIWDNLIPGEYTITEENPGTSWIITLPEDVTVTANNIAEATVTNTYSVEDDEDDAPTGSLKVTKEVIGRSGDFSFDITITNTEDASKSYTHTFRTNEEGGLEHTFTNLTPGAYRITEANPGARWRVTLPDDVIVFTDNDEQTFETEVATATVTNTYRTPPRRDEPEEEEEEEEEEIEDEEEIITFDEEPLPETVPNPEPKPDNPNKPDTPNNDQIIELDEEPLAQAIPQTGGIPLEALSLIGVALTGIGAVLRKKNS